MGSQTAIVIGGGLAGMTVSRELAKAGLQVTLLESSPRLGGKASAKLVHGFWEDHGFHFFPGWYVNTRRLLQEIDCTSNLIDLHRFHFLRRGEFPNYVTYKEFAWKNIPHNVLNGMLPLPEWILSYYFLMDLAAEPLSSAAFLDRISASGLLRSRFYATEAIALQHHQNALQGSAIPYHDISAKTMQKLVRAWFRTPVPFASILNGNLQHKFIDPFEEDIRSLGVRVFKSCDADSFELDGSRIRFVYANPRTNKGREELAALYPDTELISNEKRFQLSADYVVLAVPHARALEFIDGRMFLAEQHVFPREQDRRGLADLCSLVSAPMAACHLHLKRKIPDIMSEHVGLVHSRYGMTFVDVSQYWEGLDHTALNIIASHFSPFKENPRLAKQAVVDELREYLPTIRDEDIDLEERCYFQDHIEEPLFLNTVGSWHIRPDSRQGTGLRNLFVTGDYCRSSADLATMESAIGSALDAARGVLDRAGIRSDVAPLPVPEYPEIVLRLLKYAALPVVGPMGLVLGFRDRLRRWGESSARK